MIRLLPLFALWVAGGCALSAVSGPKNVGGTSLDAGVGDPLPDSAALADGGPVPSSDRPWVMGYYYGRDDAIYPVSAIDWTALTHVAAAFYVPQSDGSLDEALGLDKTSGPALARDLVAAAHAHGAKAIASVGGAKSQGAFQLATAQGALSSFVANLGSLIDRYGYDGLDIDWEPLDPTDQPAVVAVAEQLRASHQHVILTVAVNYTNPNKHTDLSGYAAIAAAYDRVNVMTYGMAGAWQGWKSWHTSALYYTDTQTPSSIDDSVSEYLAAGVPASKLAFGISSFGLCYGQPVTGPDQALGASESVSDVAYADIMQSYAPAGTRQFDSLARVPYLSFDSPAGPSQCTFITYDDAQSISEKGAYLRSKALGGVIVWRISRGYTAPTNALLDAVKTGFSP